MEVSLQQKIQEYRQSNSKLTNLSDKQILSIMVENGVISLTREQENSIYTKPTDEQNMKGLSVEKNPMQQTQNSDSGKHIHSDVIVESSDGRTYNLNQTLANRINAVSENVKKAEDENGIIGSAWSGYKNLTGIGDSSDKVREHQEVEKKLLAQFNSNEQRRPEIFKELTGVDYTPENLDKFIKGEIRLHSEKALTGYTEGQKMAVDIGADIAAGVAAVAIYTTAIAAAPFTAGGSIAAGVAIAGTSAAAIKTGLKYADAKTGGREYTLSDAGSDAVSGAFSGVIAPVTAGIGGAVGKTIATRFGLQAVKNGGVSTIIISKTGVAAKKAIVKVMGNPAGYKYSGGALAGRAVAYGSQMAVDIGVDAVDAGFTAFNSDSSKDIVYPAIIENERSNFTAYNDNGSQNRGFEAIEIAENKKNPM